MPSLRPFTFLMFFKSCIYMECNCQQATFMHSYPFLGHGVVDTPLKWYGSTLPLAATHFCVVLFRQEVSEWLQTEQKPSH